MTEGAVSPWFIQAEYDHHVRKMEEALGEDRYRGMGFHVELVFGRYALLCKGGKFGMVTVASSGRVKMVQVPRAFDDPDDFGSYGGYLEEGNDWASRSGAILAPAREDSKCRVIGMETYMWTGFLKKVIEYLE
jgi:hypothetical protein